jgi:hypothetical protein
LYSIGPTQKVGYINFKLPPNLLGAVKLMTNISIIIGQGEEHMSVAQLGRLGVDAILKEEEGALLWARGGLGSGHTCGGQV